jgi:hypothetical protein
LEIPLVEYKYVEAKEMPMVYLTVDYLEATLPDTGLGLVKPWKCYSTPLNYL